MVRTQILLTEQQFRQLRLIAGRQGISMAELIRRAVDRALATEVLPGQEEIRRKARMAVGKYADSANNVSEQHDRYLIEAFGS